MSNVFYPKFTIPYKNFSNIKTNGMKRFICFALCAVLAASACVPAVYTYVSPLSQRVERRDDKRTKDPYPGIRRHLYADDASKIAVRTYTNAL